VIGGQRSEYSRVGAEARRDGALTLALTQCGRGKKAVGLYMSNCKTGRKAGDNSWRFARNFGNFFGEEGRDRRGGNREKEARNEKNPGRYQGFLGVAEGI
jgi:hypothetical protein